MESCQGVHTTWANSRWQQFGAKHRKRLPPSDVWIILHKPEMGLKTVMDIQKKTRREQEKRLVPGRAATREPGIIGGGIYL